MASSRGGSISHLRLLIDYLSKSYPSVSAENLQNSLAAIFKFASKKYSIENKVENVHSNVNTKVAKEVAPVPLTEVAPVPLREVAPVPLVVESKYTYREVMKALQSLNAYFPQLPALYVPLRKTETSASESSKSLSPKWMLKKRALVSRSSVNSRTRHLVQGLEYDLPENVRFRRTEDLCKHLKMYPESRGIAIKCSGVSRLLKMLHHTKENNIRENVREALALIGHIDPVKGRGIRILSIDGGGTRGLVALEILHHLESKTGKPIHELFDFVCGVSTGAIIAVLIGARRLSLNDCKKLYKDISSKIFSQTTFKGTAGLVWKNSFYDSDAWTDILKKHMGDMPMIETTRTDQMTKLCLVAMQANTNWIKAFLFRNYYFPYRVASHFNGSSATTLWEGVRASAAAPGYFSEFRIDDLILLDGGIMVNNPTSIAIHEARQLWADTDLQSVVSIGTGRHEPLAMEGDKSINWASRLKNFINSATDTEGVHTTLHDLLPGNVYFRFNPYLSEEVALDEIREDKLSCMIEDTKLYMRKNETKLAEAVASLTKPKGLVDKTVDSIVLKRQMWNL